MRGLYLFARIAGTPVAIRTPEVEAVVKLECFSPVPGASRQVAGLAALRSRVLTIIDVAALVDGDCGPANQRRFAIVCDISGHSYGMLVDEVLDICEVAGDPLALRGRTDPAWQKYADGVILHEGVSHLLLTLGSFVENTALSQVA
jgi:purine-binding chemotaxis protein CheW